MHLNTLERGIVVYNIDLSYWKNIPYEEAQQKLEQQLTEIYKEVFDADEQIVFYHTLDFYVKQSNLGLVLRNIQTILNEVDISNAFALIKSTNPNIEREMELLKQISNDLVPIKFEIVTGEYTATQLELHPSSKKEEYAYGSVNPLKISLENISDRERYLLTDSKVFCMYPWIHMHAWPTGEAFPCCMSEHTGSIGNCKKSTLKEIWNSDQMKEIRSNMLNDKESVACARCYEEESYGFFSGRQSSNKHHGHLIDRVLETKSDGHYNRFELLYWDIRFSNLCNLKCRSCGHIFSSQWHKDQIKLSQLSYWDNVRDQSWPDDPPSTMEEFEKLPENIKTELLTDFNGEMIKHIENGKKLPVLNIAGRFETDMLEQLLEHIDYVEQIYFAGGEPLVMDEHYIILDELIKRGKTDVRLIYNTNFTQVKLKDKNAFEQWRHFPRVAVGASLDAMGKYAEYIRSGTKWADVENNRMKMMETCPHVDFYVSPTLSIMNALHLPDFHRDWVEKGLISPQDFNINILQDPVFYRIDIATDEYKEQIREKFIKHLEWLEPLDKLNRATNGYQSALRMLENNNTKLLEKFWLKTKQLDRIRNENVLEYIPELKALQL
jgi:hypothetical protein